VFVKSMWTPQRLHRALLSTERVWVRPSSYLCVSEERLSLVVADSYFLGLPPLLGHRPRPVPLLLLL